VGIRVYNNHTMAYTKKTNGGELNQGMRGGKGGSGKTSTGKSLKGPESKLGSKSGPSQPKPATGGKYFNMGQRGKG
jgi:hypothetical protein